MHYYLVSFRVAGKKYEGMKESEERLENFHWQMVRQARNYFRVREIEELEVLEYSQDSHSVKQLLQEREVVACRRDQEEFTPFSSWQKTMHAKRSASGKDARLKAAAPMPPINKSEWDTPERRAILEQVCELCRQELQPDHKIFVNSWISPKEANGEMAWITISRYDGVNLITERNANGIPLRGLAEEQVNSIAADVISQVKERRPTWFKTDSQQ